MKFNYFTIILIIFVLLLSFKMYHDSEMFQLRCIISDVDGNEYCVRDRTKLDEAADLLATTTTKSSKYHNYSLTPIPALDILIEEDQRPHRLMELI